MLFGGHLKVAPDLDFLRNHGFDFGEMVFQNAKNRSEWLTSGILNDFSDGFFIIGHGPREGPPNEIKHLWESYYPSLVETVNLACDMRIAFLTVHLWMDHRFVRSDSRAEKLRVLNSLISYAKLKDVAISLENLSESATDLERVLEAVPDLKITLDVGHGQLLSQRNTAFEIIERLSQLISHLHFHDNRGGSGVKDDLHLPVGAGIVDFPGIVEALVLKGYDGTMTLEVAPEDLDDSKARIKALMRGLSHLSKVKAHEKPCTEAQ